MSGSGLPVLSRAFLAIALMGMVADAHNIAVFVPYMANSQVIFNKRVAETLANAGHNVSLFVLALYEYDFPPISVNENVKWCTATRKISFHPIVFDLTNAKTAGVKNILDQNHFVNVSNGLDGESLMNIHSQIVFENIPFWDKRQRTVIRKMLGLVNACEKLIANDSLIEYIRDQKFDLAFAYMHAFCPLGLIHAAGIPSWIWMNTGTLADFVADVSGVPLPPSYCTPTMMDAGDVLNFPQRVASFIGWGVFRMIWPRVFANRETAIFRRKYGDDFPDLMDLAKKTPLVMANTNELYDFPRPTLSKIINVGGLGISKNKAKPLEEIYANLTESSSDGHVVMSFGSIAPMFLMPQVWKDAFAYAFAQFPGIQFFVRYEKNDLDDVLPSNVHIAKVAAPDRSLVALEGPSLITHGGYNSLQDAIHAGVPMVAIPLFFDQPRNAHLAEKLGFGVYLNKDATSRPENAVYGGTETRHSGAPSRQVDEFVAEFKTLDHMIPPGVHLSWIQYHSLDVMAFLVFAVFAGVWLTKRLIRCMRGVLFSSPVPSVKEKTS